MKFTSTPFAALKLFLFVFFFSVTSASYIRSEAFQPGGEYAEYEPFTIVVSDFMTDEVYHTAPMHWQVVAHESAEVGGDPTATFLSVEYFIPEEIHDNPNAIRYLLTGGPEDRDGVEPVCGINFVNGDPAMVFPDQPVSFQNDPVRSIFCLISVR